MTRRGAPGRGPRLTVRRALTLLGVSALLYVAVLGGLLQFVVYPQVDALRQKTEASLEAHEAIENQLVRVNASVLRVERVLRSARDGRPVHADTVRALREDLASLLEAISEPDVPALYPHLGDEVRILLGRAAASQIEVASGLAESVELLAEGRRTEAIAPLMAASSPWDEATAHLRAARRQAMEALARQEAELAGTLTAGALLTWVWLAGWLLAFAGAALFLRRRMYRRLAELERRMAEVAEGRFDVTVEVQEDDEIGRLGTLFNQMTQVLLDRAAREEQRRMDIVQRYSHLLDEAGLEIYALDPRTLRVRELNRRARGNLTLAEERLATLSMYDVWTAPRPLIDETLAPLRSGERPEATLLTEQRRGDGSTYPVEVVLLAAPDDDPPTLMALVHDLTDRQRLERVQDRIARFVLEKRRILQGGEPEEVLGAITEFASELLDVRRASIWTLVGDRIICRDGYDRAEGAHTRGEELLKRDYPEYFRALARGEPIAAEDARTDPRTASLFQDYLGPMGIGAMLDTPIEVDGRLHGVICLEHVGPPRAWSQEDRATGAMLADFVAQAFELEQRRSAERALADSEARLRRTFETAPVGLAEVDLKGRLVQVNAKLVELLRATRESVVGRPWHEFVHPDDLPRVRAAAEGLGTGALGSYHREVRLQTAGGAPVWVDASASPIRHGGDTPAGFLLALADVSEARELRSQLAHTEKLDSIGRLAGTIAHDFNNVLTTIVGAADLLRSSIPEGSVDRHEVEQILEAAERARTLTRQLLTFSRARVTDPRIIDVDAAVQRSVQFLRRSLGERIALTADLSAEGATVRLGDGQIEQVLMNLGINARDAMPEGGTVTVRTRKLPGDALVPAWTDVEAEAWVEIAVEDSGVGIPEEDLEHIFEPFFSTKREGEGTGIGLASCYGIIRQAGGTIEVDSEVGRGTTFRVLLPAAGLPADAPAADRPSEEEAHEGRERILLVEDDDAIRLMVLRALTMRGYEVLTAADGVEALELVHDDGGTVDVLVTDTVMPRMGGPELARRLRARFPELVVLFVSGYPADSLEELQGAGDHFLAKPFTPTELVSRLQELLARRPPPWADEE